MSSTDPPSFNTSVFNATAFVNPSEILTLGDANNKYLQKINPSITGSLGIGTSNLSNQLTLSLDSAAKPSTNTWTVSSDERVKEDIQDADLDVCYENVKKLKLKYFKWKDKFIDSHSIEDKHKLGWIAQEVETMIPKAVTTTNNEIYGIEDFKLLNSDQIIACMYGAIQKLIEKVESM